MKKADGDRETRLAEALRANLRRRKAQARDQATDLTANSADVVSDDAVTGRSPA